MEALINNTINSYVTHTCFICGGAFIDIDELNCQNIPPSYKACMECRGNRKKDITDKKNKRIFIKEDDLITYILNNTPKEDDESFNYYLDNYKKILKSYLKNNQKISNKKIFKELEGWFESYKGESKEDINV